MQSIRLTSYDPSQAGTVTKWMNGIVILGIQPRAMDMKPSKLPGISDLFTKDEAEDMDRLVPIRTFKKGTVLLKAGQVATDAYFCVKGCVHMYYDVDGDERTTEFYTEGQAVCFTLQLYQPSASEPFFSLCLRIAHWWFGATLRRKRSLANTPTWSRAAVFR
jgi:signal-transduction protein with cAMP-binding, CBS, and nucleotidyltransferase domain